MTHSPTDQNARPSKRLWKHVRKGIAESSAISGFFAGGIAAYFRLVKSSNTLVHDDGPKVDELLASQGPLIFTCWHGQHFMLPFLIRDGEPSAMLVSRSKDAELNARIVEKAGIIALRGSGGREQRQDTQKGGARALIAMRNHLRTGHSVAVIADVPKGTPRQSGMGIITLAKISGRPIVPIAFATSKRHIFANAWDKAALNKPFGRAALVAGDLVHVPADADENMMEAARLSLQTGLNTITDTAYAHVDGKFLETSGE